MFSTSQNNSLKLFGSVTGPLGAFFALSFPDPLFSNLSILLPRCIGFYFTHINILVIGILLMTLGLAELEFKNLGKMFLTALILSVSIHVLNSIFVYSGINEKMNYFYTMHDAGVSILKMFYDFIPIKFLYLIPAVPILLVYSLILIGIKKLFKRLKNN